MSKLDDAFEIHLPWWLNNLIRWIVGFPIIPIYMVWTAFEALRAVFSGGSRILEWPWDWGWIDWED